VIPFITNIIVWLPGGRDLIWSSISIQNSPIGIITHFEHGWWYYIQAYFSFSIASVGVFYLVRGLSLFPQQYNKSIKLLLLSSLLPLLINIGYTFNSDGYYGLDLTSISISISSILFYFAISKRQLLNSIPMAWNNVVENINEGIIIISNDGKVIGNNPAFQNILHSVCPQEAEGKSIEELFYNCPTMSDFIADNTRNRVFLSVKGHCYEVTKNTIHDNAGIESGLILIFYNMTEIKSKESEIEAMNSKLKEANETKDLIFRVISHDLRGPVGNITSLLGLFAEQKRPLEGYNLETLYKTSLNASFLIENLLYWANSQRNQLKIDPVCNIVSATISNAIETLNPQASSKNVIIRNNCNENIKALFDAPTFEIVIRNLISNAIKFTKPEGSVEINVKPHNDSVLIEIIDDGIGMSDDLVENIRNNIMVPSSYGTMQEKGTGIGLPMCQNLVKSNNGTLTISSVLNVGTKITIALPACA